MTMNVRALFLILCLALAGCISQTIRPTDIAPTSASFDGNVKDSGIIAVTPTGTLVTSHARDRYNGLIAVYGSDKEFVPALVPDQGVKPAPLEAVVAANRGPLFVLDQQAVVNFAKMNRWRRMGKPNPAAPVPPPPK
jgi:hypothetical protein